MCAAIAPVTNQVAANTKANIGMAARVPPLDSLPARARVQAAARAE
jgi:hypothetical protein